MADNVVSMKKKNKNPQKAEEEVGTFVSKNRKPLLITVIVLAVAVIAVCVSIAVIEKNKVSGISKIDAIEYTLTKDSTSLSEDELMTRRNTALTDLGPYLTKKSIVGVRANMLAADITMQKKDFGNSKTYWIAAAEDDKNAYTAPICWYNAGVCSEQLGDNESAAKQYQNAADAKDFMLVTHALFSVGRVKEATNEYTGAAAAYNKMVDKYPNDEWTKLARSRLISLKADGKITEDAPAADTTKTTK